MMRRFPEMIPDGAKSALPPPLMLPISRDGPSGAAPLGPALGAGHAGPGVAWREGRVPPPPLPAGDPGRKLNPRGFGGEKKVRAEPPRKGRPLPPEDDPFPLPHRAGLEMPRETRFAA